MSKQEATRLADHIRIDQDWCEEAAALLRQWPDGEPVAWQAQVFNVRHLTGEVRLRGIDGAEVPQDFVESGTIVEVRAARTAPRDATARIAELERERDDFHMQYRVKCDEETKAQAVRIAELEDELKLALKELKEFRNKMIYGEDTF